MDVDTVQHDICQCRVRGAGGLEQCGSTLSFWSVVSHSDSDNTQGRLLSRGHVLRGHVLQFLRGVPGFVAARNISESVCASSSWVRCTDQSTCLSTSAFTACSDSQRYRQPVCTADS